MNASWPQTKTIWSICIKVKEAGYTGLAVDSQFWKRMSDEGRLDRETASKIIGAFISKEFSVFQSETLAFDHDFQIDTLKFRTARRWEPKKKTQVRAVPPTETTRKLGNYYPTSKFNVGDSVTYIGNYYPWLKESVGVVKVVKGSQIGVVYDPWPTKAGSGIGHDLEGLLRGTPEDGKGWFCSDDHLALATDLEENPEAEEESEIPAAKSDGPEDEFERKLKELEAAHKKSKEAAAKVRALEKFRPESIEYVKPEIFDDVCAMIKGGVQVCLVGPSGCGKSLLVTEISKVLKRDLYVESFAGGKRYSQVFGSTHLVDGKSEWMPAKFMEELQKENNIVFMDEVMSADPDVLIGANPILDRKSRCFHSPIGVIRVAPSCTICAASNVTGREYSMNYKGTQQQDASVLNRFVHVHMSYDKKVESTIMKKAPLDDKDKAYLLDSLDKLRRAINTHNISYDPSTRKLVQSIELIVLGLPTSKAFEYSFLAPLSQVERTKISM
jgi:MoxR-like ATPase